MEAFRALFKSPPPVIKLPTTRQSKYPAALEPFTLRGQIENLDGEVDERIETDVFAAIRNADEPETVAKIFETAFDYSSASELGDLLAARNIPLQRAVEVAKDILAHKGITITLLNGTQLSMTGTATVPAYVDKTGPDFAVFNQIICGTGLPPVLGDIVADYLRAPRIRVDTMREGPKTEIFHKFGSYLRQAAEQDKLATFSFLSFQLSMSTGKQKIIGVDLAGLNLARLRLWNVALIGANLQNARLDGAKFFYTSIIDSDLRGTSLRGATFGNHSALQRCQFSDATDFSQITLRDSAIMQSPFPAATVMPCATIADSALIDSPIPDGALLHASKFNHVTLENSPIGQPKKALTTTNAATFSNMIAKDQASKASLKKLAR